MSAYYVPGTVLGARSQQQTKQTKIPALEELTFEGMETRQIDKENP